jgi:nitroimidazol reductase NimA-like FMN-containing flavoprotein (pyridoxamine 5'-phosphate oxidase superfamily)
MAQSPADHARAIIDANLYMTLATADRDGKPWATPVYFYSADYRRFYWMSTVDAVHSRNVAVRPEVGLAIFDSTVAPYTGRAVYASAVAAELSGDEVREAVRLYPGPPERDAGRVDLEDVTPPSEYRMYAATASELFILCPRERGKPCEPHGLMVDHRAPVEI